MAMGAAALAVLAYRAMRARAGPATAAPGDGGAAQEPADRRGHHQGRAAGAGVLGAGPGRARDGAYAGRRRRPAGSSTPSCSSSATGSTSASAQELKRGLDALFADGRPFSRCSRRRPAAMSRRTAGPPAGGPSCACATWPGASATSPASSTSIACWCATRWPGARCSTRCRCRSGSARADGRIEWVNEAYVKAVEASERGGGARAPDRAAGDAPARGGAARRWPRARPTASACTSSAAARARRTTWWCCRSTAPRVGAAIDVAALETAQGELGRHVAAYERTLDRVATGVAIFGPDQRLDLLQRGLSQAVAARCRLAGHQADRRRAARPPARAVAPARGGQLPRLEGQDPGRLQDRHRVRGLVAPARRPHHPRGRRRSAPTAASPISTTTPPSASRWRAATTP